jgi:hypothetical protein
METETQAGAAPLERVVKPLHRRQAKAHLKVILSRVDRKNAPCLNARSLKEATEFSVKHGLELPPDVDKLIIVKVFRLMIQRGA